MVVGWSPCMELEISSVVSEVQSIEGSIDLANVADVPPGSMDGNDLTFEFSDQQYRWNKVEFVVWSVCLSMINRWIVGIAKRRRPAQVYLQRRPAVSNHRALFQSIHLHRLRQRPISANSFRYGLSRLTRLENCLFVFFFCLFRTLFHTHIYTIFTWLDNCLAIISFFFPFEWENLHDPLFYKEIVNF